MRISGNIWKEGLINFLTRAIVSFNRADVLRENIEAVFAACDAAHGRWAKLLGVRALLHPRLRLQDFLQIYNMTKLKAMLDQETWVEVDVPNEFQGIMDSLSRTIWSPDKSSIFGSSAEDGVLNIWDHNKVGERSGPASKFAPGLLFRHSGHRNKVVDFHWNSHDPWTIVIVSDDGESTGGGGTLQFLLKCYLYWLVEMRMIDLIHRPQEEVINELEQLITSSLFLMLKLFPNLGFGNLIRVYSTCELQWSLDFESMFHLFDKKIQVLLSFIPRFSSHLWKALVLKTKQDMDIQDRELVNDWLMIIVYKERGNNLIERTYESDVNGNKFNTRVHMIRC
uniref:Uncharacterized protein n=1 Tax=Lactuca sativa TaxID=4236 RepID=A0A9R1WC24_LACSA|nr:hypothetical protein LSAT_V11C300121960 [Lactuca sativa]